MNRLGFTPDMVGDQVFWEACNKLPDFWITMPVMPGAHAYWAQIKHLNPPILSGAPKSDFERAERDKKQWWWDNFRHDNVIVCRSRDKQNWCHNPDDTLVDDKGYILKRWVKAGGCGILFRNFPQVLAEMKKLGIL